MFHNDNQVAKLIYKESSAKTYAEAVEEITELKNALTNVHLENKHYE